MPTPRSKKTTTGRTRPGGVTEEAKLDLQSFSKFRAHPLVLSLVKKYQQDAKKLNADGYRVVSVVPARKFMKGFVLVVTYERFSTGH